MSSRAMPNARSVASRFVGNSAAVELLRAAAASGRMPHAYLFTGPPHVGKATLARLLAQSLLCEDSSAGDLQPCSACRACARIDHSTHPDVQVFNLSRQDETSNRSTPSRALGIDTVREIVADIGMLPFEASCKVYIVEDAETLTEEAANGFLKTLEEPPAYATLILLATDAAALPETIRSRCTIVRLGPVGSDEIRELLESADRSHPEQAGRIADLSAGRPGWALRAMSDPSLIERHDANVASLIEALEGGAAARISLAERINKRWTTGHRDEVYSALFDWLGFWREVMMVASGGEAGQALAPFRPQVETCASRGLPQASSSVDATLNTISMLDANVNTRMAVESLLLSFPTPK